jgi:glyoxylase-like metal-dependent hydrolase (beta-lactamase superfamily II)
VILAWIGTGEWPSMLKVHVVTECGSVLRLTTERSAAGFPAYRTSAYLVDGLLIDTGCAHGADAMAATLGNMDVRQVVNTHCHEDHIGANAVLQEMHDCPVLAHEEALSIIQDPRKQRLQLYRRFLWGMPQASSPTPISESVRTSNHHLTVIHTPGHSRGHICLLDAERGWLFSGDAYIGGRDRVLRAGYDIVQMRESLRKLLACPIATIFSGSGSVRTNGAAALAAKVAFLDELGDHVLALHRQGLSPRQIRRKLLGKEPALTYVTLGHFSGLRLIRSFLSTGQLSGPDAIT